MTKLTDAEIEKLAVEYQSNRLNYGYEKFVQDSFKAGYLKCREMEASNVTRLYHELCHEWTETCADECSSWGHSEGCKNVNIGEAKKALQSQLSEIKALNDYLTSGFVHTCHAECDKPLCVKFREKDKYIEELESINVQISRISLEKSEKLKIATDALDKIGKKQHAEGKRRCVCEIIGKTREEMSAINGGSGE